MKVDWPVECLPIKIGFGFLKDIWKSLLDGYGHIWMRMEKQSSESINFLKQKYAGIDMLTRA